MSAYYLESSALVKRYNHETGSHWVRSLTAPTSGNTIYVARITIVETTAAITRQGRHLGVLTPVAVASLNQLQANFRHEFVLVEVTPALLNHAMALARRHALRGYDAVQLAAALETHTSRTANGLPALTLVSADVELNAAALLEGLVVDNPNHHP